MRSSLARYQPRSLADADQLWLMRRAAWRQQGVIVLRPADIADDWLRQAVINLAERLYGTAAPS